MNSSNNDKKWFYLASGLVGLLTTNFIYEKASAAIKSKKAAKEQEKTGQDGLSPTKSPELPLLEQPKLTMNKYQTSFKPQNIYKICLTGGPCAGKTTAMTHISERLREMGIRVYIVPEAATLVANGGGLIDVGKMNTHQRIKLQSVIIKYIMDMEDHFVNLAALSDNPTETAVVLCDRGAMDPSAYMKQQEWHALLDEYGWNTVNLRDKRYDGVVHLVTAADGAEEFYSLANNQARYESTVELAKEIDKKLRDAWVGHPQFVIVNNDFKEFNDKVRKVYSTVLHMIGRPQEAPKFYKKYLLEREKEGGIPKLPEDPNMRVEVFTMDDTYLECADPRIEEKIRKRGQKDSFSYTHSITVYDHDFVHAANYTNDGIETKKQITAREYLFLIERKDKTRVTLDKLRQCFIWEGQHYFIDTFRNVGGAFSLLMIEKGKDVQKLNLPPFIKIKKDVTDLREASSFELAKVTNKDVDLYSVLKL